MTERAKYVKQNTTFKLTHKVKRYYQNKTYSFHVLRCRLYKNPFSNDIVVTPELTFIPHTLLMNLKSPATFLDDISESYEAEYTMTDPLYNVFCEEDCREELESSSAEMEVKGLKVNLAMRTRVKWYHSLIFSIDKNLRPDRIRVDCLTSEMSVMKQLFKKSKLITTPNNIMVREEELEAVSLNNDNIVVSLSNLLDSIMRKLPKKIDKVKYTAVTDMKSSLKEMSNEELTYKKFKVWEKVRHDLFATKFCDLMSWEIDTDLDLDVNLVEKFNYFGVDFHLTPDKIMRMPDGTLLIVDFAVTTGNPGVIRENKVRKYSDLRAGLSDFLKEKVELDAVVMKISGDLSFQIPNGFENLAEKLMNDKDIHFLREIHLKMSMKDNYERFKKMSDREDHELKSEDPELLDNIKEVISHKVAIKRNLINVKTKDIGDSRKDHTSASELVKLEDMAYYKDMEKFTAADMKEYTRKLNNTLSDMTSEDSFNKLMSEISDHSNSEAFKKLEQEERKLLEIRAQCIGEYDFKIPKLFKMPMVKMMIENMPKEYQGYTPTFWNKVWDSLDGTSYLAYTPDMEEITEEEQNKNSNKYPVLGYGASSEEDIPFVEEVLEYMLEDRYEENSDSYADMNNDTIDSLRKVRMWDLLEFVSDLVLNISYLEGRRYAMNDVLKSKDGYTIFKNFGSYMLLIKKGSKMTSQKQIRFKLIAPTDSIIFLNTPLTHSWKRFEFDNRLMKTSWLTISMTDIRHYLRSKEVAISLLSDMNDKTQEMNRRMHLKDSSLNKSFATMMIIYLENKRGTSTTLQLNRYLLHSATSYITDKSQLVSDINKNPVRSRMEAYIRIMQMRWYKRALTLTNNLNKERVFNMSSTDTDYDRFMMPSFYNLNATIEFSILMSEIYTSNLFDKEAGFTSHRLKSVVDKASEAEMHFQKVKNEDWSKGNITDIKRFLQKKDELHGFDKNYVKAATFHFFNDPLNKIKANEALMEAMTEVVDGAMMMSSSLKSGPYHSEAFSFSSKIVKDKSFVTIFEELEKYSSHFLLELSNCYDKAEAIFTIFPKAQIGGPREILIMSVKIRIMVKFLEVISHKMCKIHPKEMITKEKMKAETQSETMNEMRDNLRILRKKGATCITASLNQDASKWAPGFVMEHFMEFVNNWDVDDKMKMYMLSVISSFSSKIIMVPELLKEKWANKPDSEKDFNKGIQHFREETLKNGTFVKLNSGMGQGMFHRLSSFYHAVMDDYMDEVLKTYMWNNHRTIVDSKTLLSSDDKTKMLLFRFEGGPSTAEKSLMGYMRASDSMSRLANIHLNWKKSGLNLLICEFNSLFSIGKRMCWATIKDIYTAHLLPDLTCPEEAVVFMLSNIRRCMEHGMYIPTLNLMMKIARRMLEKYYMIDAELKNKLKAQLDCTEDSLPFQLGFMPVNNTLEVLLMGPEITMFSKDNSDTLNKFFYNMFSASVTDSVNSYKKVVPFSEESCGKYWFELPNKLDKRLIEMKNNFFKNVMMVDKETVMDNLNRFCLNVNLSINDPKRSDMFKKTFFIGMNRMYEFQETMTVHSLVRALQMSTAKGILKPESPRVISSKNRMEELNSIIEEKHSLGEEAWDDINEMAYMRILAENDTNDLDSFTREILKLEPKRSSISLYSSLSKVMDMSDQVKQDLSSMVPKKKNSHPMMRVMRFNTTDNLISVKPIELLNYLFEPETNPRNLTIQAFVELKRMLAVELDFDEFENPFLFIEKLMKGEKMCFKAFKDFLEINFKSFKNLKLSMLSDIPCYGNLKDNLLNLYRTKSDPSCILEYSGPEYRREETSLSFLTKISLNKMDNISTSITGERVVYPQDNSVTRMMKITMDDTFNWTDSKTVDYRRIEYSTTANGDYTIKSWTNLEMLVKAYETKAEVKLYVYSSNLMKDNVNSESLVSIIKRYINEMKLKGKYIQFAFTGEFDEKSGLFYLRSKLWFKVTIDRMTTKWTSKLVVSIKRDIMKKKELLGPSSASFFMLTDRYTVDNATLMSMKFEDNYGEEVTMRKMMQEVPDLKSLEKMFLTKGWIKELVIPKKEEDYSSMEGKFSVNAINASFGAFSIMDTVSSMMGVINKVNEETEEEPNLLSTDIGMRELDFGEMDMLKKALEISKSASESDLTPLEIEGTENYSLVRVMDMLITKAVSLELDIKKENITKYCKMLRSTNSSTTSFHNLLFNQVLRMYNYDISDVMALIIYNIILKNSATTVNLMPIDSMRKIKVKDDINPSFIFVDLKSNSYEDSMLLANDFES